VGIVYIPDTKGYLDITFGPIWDYIPLTRNFVENFLLVNLIDKTSISKIAMSTAELLENAVRFSTNDGIRLKLTKREETNEVTVDVYNYAGKEETDKLLTLIDEMKKVDSLQFYLGQMKRSVTRTDGRSCLGIARINHEAKAEIIVNYLEDKKITHVQAKFKY